MVNVSVTDISTLEDVEQSLSVQLNQNGIKTN